MLFRSSVVVLIFVQSCVIQLSSLETYGQTLSAVLPIANPIGSDIALPQSQHTTSTDCQLKSGGESAVLDVYAPLTLHLADGRYVRLAEILMPQTGTSFDASLSALNHVRQITLGKRVEIKFGGTQKDRYGVYIAHVFLKDDQETWLQKTLIEQGYAQAYSQTDNHACATYLIKSEDQARQQKRGLWGQAIYKIMDAADARGLLNLVQTYQIIEGTVQSSIEKGTRLVLHFGKDEKWDTEAVIEAPIKKKLSEIKNSKDLKGVRVRLRGWIEKRRGPFMAVTQLEEIQILTDGVSKAQ